MYKVLIVEDDPMVAMINEQYILKNKNFTVAGTCKNGNDALEFLQENQVDLILLDVFMPIMNGCEVLKKIREQKIDAEVIMVTAANDTSTLEETVHLGVIDYLIKPFAFDRFNIALEKFSSKKEALQNRKTFDQSFIDSLINTSRVHSEVKLPKGIQAKTLNLIKNHLSEKKRWESGDMLAESLGISIVTVRHYMNYLVKCGFAMEDIDYETGGRPCLLYKSKM